MTDLKRYVWKAEGMLRTLREQGADDVAIAARFGEAMFFEYRAGAQDVKATAKAEKQSKKRKGKALEH